MAIVLPSLTPEGYISDRNLMMNKIYSYFITSDYSQSVRYYGNISSLKYLIRKHGTNHTGLLAEVRTMLNDLYLRYFDKVTVNAAITEIPITGSSKTNTALSIDVIAIHDGVEFSLSETSYITDNKISEIDDTMSMYYNH